MFTFITLYTALIISNILDLKSLKIPNYITFSVMILGLGFSTFFHGWFGLYSSFLSLVIVYLVFLIPWQVLHALGGGDVKLLMGISSFLGYYLTLRIGFFAVIFGAFLFLFTIPFSKVISMFKNLFYLIFYKIPLLSEKSELTRKPFSFPILISFFLVTNGFI